MKPAGLLGDALERVSVVVTFGGRDPVEHHFHYIDQVHSIHADLIKMLGVVTVVKVVVLEGLVQIRLEALLVLPTEEGLALEFMGMLPEGRLLFRRELRGVVDGCTLAEFTAKDAAQECDSVHVVLGFFIPALSF